MRFAGRSLLSPCIASHHSPFRPLSTKERDALCTLRDTFRRPPTQALLAAPACRENAEAFAAATLDANAVVRKAACAGIGAGAESGVELGDQVRRGSQRGIRAGHRHNDCNTLACFQER